ENDRLVELLHDAGATLTSGQKNDIRGLLSGSDAAQAALRALAPAAADQVERIVNSAFMDGYHAVMFLSVAVTAVPLLAPLAARGPAPASVPPHPAPATHAHVQPSASPSTLSS